VNIRSQVLLWTAQRASAAVLALCVVVHLITIIYAVRNGLSAAEILELKRLLAQAERSGRGVKVLVLDEAMYFADSEYAEAFMRMLQNLTKCFTQIIVVSHSDLVLASIRNKIFFAKPIGGRTTIQCDFEGPTV